MTSRHVFSAFVCVQLLLLAACEFPAAWAPSDEGDAGAPMQLGSIAPTRSLCGEGDASCDVPLGRYSIRYTFVSGTCRDESSETGVRFSDDSEHAEDFPCDDHEVAATPDHALYVDRECTMRDPIGDLVVRRTRAQATIYGPNRDGEISGRMNLSVLQGQGAPCTAQYLLHGTRE